MIKIVMNIIFDLFRSLLRENNTRLGLDLEWPIKSKSYGYTLQDSSRCFVSILKPL